MWNLTHTLPSHGILSPLAETILTILYGAGDGSSCLDTKSRSTTEHSAPESTNTVSGDFSVDIVMVAPSFSLLVNLSLRT